MNNKEISLYNSIIYLSNKRCLLRVEFQRLYKNNKIEFVATVYEHADVLSNCEERNYLSFNLQKSLVGVFSVEVMHSNQSIQLGPEGQLGMLNHDYQGLSIGRYCISKLLVFAAADVSPFNVLPGKLSFQDAKTTKEKANRNTFYKKLGLTLKLDTEEQNGTFFCVDSRQLSLGWNKGKLRELNSLSLMKAYERAHEQNNHINRLQEAYESKEESLTCAWKENAKLKKWLALLFVISLFLVAALFDVMQLLK